MLKFPMCFVSLFFTGILPSIPSKGIEIRGKAQDPIIIGLYCDDFDLLKILILKILYFQFSKFSKVKG